MNIRHKPYLNTDLVCDHYTKKDGVPVKYVCTSAIDSSIRAMDIFYRDTPHPKFGNRYFGIYHDGNSLITNADAIENLEFGMIKSKGVYHYSQHRHDYVSIDGYVIDGGRAYVRGNGFEVFKVEDGVFTQPPN